MGRLIEHQKVRFIVAGGLNTALDFAILNFLVLVIHIPALLANLISVGIGITISYFLNHFFVFRSNESVSWRSYALFFGLTGFSSLIIQDVVIYLFQQFFATPPSRSIFLSGPLSWIFAHKALQLNVAKAVAVGIGMIWNFLLYKYVVFRVDNGKLESLKQIER